MVVCANITACLRACCIFVAAGGGVLIHLSIIDAQTSIFLIASVINPKGGYMRPPRKIFLVDAVRP